MRLSILAPAIAGLAFVLVMFGVYSILCAVGRTPDIKGVDRRRFTEILGPHLVRYMLWLIRPVERVVVAGGISPNVITSLSLLLCIASGVTIAQGHLATGAWLYAFGGVTDILDGRIARATNRQSKAGALFDSVSDRWGELAVLTGCAWYLHEDAWLFTAMLAIAGSVMVSYTRARGEGLGVNLDGGMMQRAERIIVVSLGAALVLCGAFASVTAIGRWIEGYRLLAEREAEAERAKASATSAIKSQVPAG